jgi:hypothetical protein
MHTKKIFAILTLNFLILSCGKSNSADSFCETDSCGYCSPERVGLKVCSFIATPTASESVTLKNYTDASINLNNYTLWDSNAYGNGTGEKTLSSSDIISAGGTLTYGSLPFVINDSGETIYLKDASGVLVHSRSN